MQLIFNKLNVVIVKEYGFMLVQSQKRNELYSDMVIAGYDEVLTIY